MKTPHFEMEHYTLGIWTVKPGMDSLFVEEWTTFAKWTSAHIEGCGTGYLLQDNKDPLRFISFGPWESEETIQAWRNTDAFKQFGDKVKSLCDDFQPNSLRVVASSE